MTIFIEDSVGNYLAVEVFSISCFRISNLDREDTSFSMRYQVVPVLLLIGKSSLYCDVLYVFTDSDCTVSYCHLCCMYLCVCSQIQTETVSRV